jgi:hypothetical protein
MARTEQLAASSISLLALTIVAIAIVLAPSAPASGATYAAKRAQHSCLVHAAHHAVHRRSHELQPHQKAASCVRRRYRRRTSSSPQTTWTAVGKPPLSDAKAAARVVHRPEQRPENVAANEYVPTDAELAAFHSAATAFSPLSVYVDGRDGLTKPSTDDLIQWTSVKWGIPTDWLRAVYLAESGWKQSTLGDIRQVSPEWSALYPPVAQLPNDEVYETMGIAGVKWTPGPNGIAPGTEPLRWRSTAFNMDYQASIVRYYYSDCFSCRSWPGYTRGQQWNSIGAWDEPYPWRNSQAPRYIAKVKKHLSEKPWLSDPSF